MAKLPPIFILKYSIEIDFVWWVLAFLFLIIARISASLTLSLKSEIWLQSWLEPKVKEKIVFKSFQKLKTHFKKNQGSVSLLYCNLAPSRRTPERHSAGLYRWELWEPTSVFQKNLNIVQRILSWQRNKHLSRNMSQNEKAKNSPRGPI